MGNMGFADLARLRVLVVDDDPGFHKVFKTILRGVGVNDIRVALNASAALQRDARQSPRCRLRGLAHGTP